jgi:hypothetical protein
LFLELLGLYGINWGSSSKVGDYAKRLDNLNKKKSIFLTPLNFLLKAFIFALNDFFLLVLLQFRFLNFKKDIPKF